MAAGDGPVKVGRVSVVVPVKDDRRVEACLASLREATPEGVGVQVVVVDNGSSEAFQRWLVDVAGGFARVLREPRPGAYAARNRGVAAADGEVVFFTDADCVVRPGWFEAGLGLIGEGYDIVQGYSGATGGGRIQRLLQARYERRLRRLRYGAPTETDTRNLAVRRAVFSQLVFNERYRRVGDTEFGLRAEQLGYRVGYAPTMRVDHDHDDDLRVFAAKQVCHGWGAQRLMEEVPGIRWHGGHLRLVAQLTGLVRRLPGRGVAARMLRFLALAGAGGLQRGAGALPWPVAYGALTVVDKVGLLAGHLSYRGGEPEPSPSELLGRRLLRD